MIKQRLAALISIKTFITIIITGLFAVMAYRGDISSEVVMTIVTMVLSFYFGTQQQKAKDEAEKASGL